MENLFKSKRFWVAVSALVSVALADKLPFTEQQITDIVLVVAAWIVGDSLRKTDQGK
jgi:hypothetical protein